MGDLLTAKDVAERLKCSQRFVLDELRRKNMVGVKLAAGWRIDVDDLRSYVEAHKTVRPVRPRTRPQRR